MVTVILFGSESRIFTASISSVAIISSLFLGRNSFTDRMVPRAKSNSSMTSSLSFSVFNVKSL